MHKFKLYGPKLFILFSIIELKRTFLRHFVHSYSQNKEDILIEKFSKTIITNYIDIGSNHPTKFNNTYRFYLKNARGIVIEPNKDLIKLHKKSRPKDICLNIGIANKSSSSMFYQLDPDVNSTFSRIQSQAEVNKGSILVKKYKIKTSTLKELCQKYFSDKTIDLLSIDTEGYDYLILKSNDWSLFRPKIICIENNSHRTQKLLINHNYLLRGFTPNNSIYVDTRK